MSHRPASRSSSSDTVPDRLLEVMYRSLQRGLTKQCAQRYEANVVLHRLEETGDEAPELHLRLDCRGLLRMPVQLRATPTYGGLYEVECMLDDGSSCRVSYGLSRRSGAALSPAPNLGRKLATFLLDELEKRLGRLLLQSPVGPPPDEISVLS